MTTLPCRTCQYATIAAVADRDAAALDRVRALIDEWATRGLLDVADELATVLTHA